MKKILVQGFSVILMLTFAFQPASAAALSKSPLLENNPQTSNSDVLALNPVVNQAFKTALQARHPADAPKQRPERTEPVRERPSALPNAKQIARSKAQAQTFECSFIFDVPELECQALVALYANTEGAGWYNKTKWLEPFAIDDWFGVTVTDGHVTELVLNNNRLIGIIPPEMGNLPNLVKLNLYLNILVGSIPSALGNMSSLQTLDLGSNYLSGSIPSALGSLSNLETLDLHSNRLTGSIPSALGSLFNLLFLDLNYNDLIGRIPPELGNLTSLVEFYLYNNQLSGCIPPELGSLTNLQVLDLSVNFLTGSIPPQLGNLSHLLELSLERNQLSGRIPSELGNLSSLVLLYLYANSLTGNIPLSFMQLTALKYFWFPETLLCEPPGQEYQDWKATVFSYWGTDITCFDCADVTDIPIPECEALAALYYSANGSGWTNHTNWLATTAAHDWFGVSLTSGHVSTLNLDSNLLSGIIPSELGNLAGLQMLFLRNNQLNGSVPPQLGSLTNLQSLDLHTNQLSGSIPVALGSLTSLRLLDLGDNQLTGSIPSELGSLSQLQILGLYSNQLSGAIPVALGNLTNLWIVSLADNQLSGSLPSQLGSLTQLIRLYLNDNQLSGSIPLSFINLIALDDFNFINTSLCEPDTPEFETWKGTVATWVGTDTTCFICAYVTDIPSTECLALAALYASAAGVDWTNQMNWLTATTVGNWYGVTVTDGHVEELLLDENALVGTIPTELGNLPGLLDLNLTSNQLTGGIPAGLSSLSNLMGLHLYDNQLTGSIPTQLGDMSNLRLLDLGLNPLSGGVPWQLGGLSNLEVLYLDDTQLEGCLPLTLTNLVNLDYFWFNDSNLCEPTSGDFLAWKATVPHWAGTGLYCKDGYLPLFIR